jgi:type IV pilus assembly protein PilA
MASETRAKGDDGFTLIELLVVVLIIGILAAIAVPVFLSQREKAFRSALTSDMRNAAMLVESYYSENAGYPGTGPIPDLSLSDPGEVVEVVVTGSAGYCIEGTHNGVDLDRDGSPDPFRFDTRTDLVTAGIQQGGCPP